MEFKNSSINKQTYAHQLFYDEANDVWKPVASAGDGSVSDWGTAEVTTAADGTEWTAFASQAAKKVTLRNQTAVSIVVRKVGDAGGGFLLKADESLPLGITGNLSEIEAKRQDDDNTQVVLSAVWSS